MKSVLSRKHIKLCPFLIMLPTHYREDGTCKCDCKVERKRMVEEWGYTEEHFRKAGLGT